MWIEDNKHLIIPGVNAKARGSDIIIQILYPDTDHMLIPGVNGAVYDACMETLDRLDVSRTVLGADCERIPCLSTPFRISQSALQFMTILGLFCAVMPSLKISTQKNMTHTS